MASHDTVAPSVIAVGCHFGVITEDTNDIPNQVFMVGIGYSVDYEPNKSILSIEETHGACGRTCIFILFHNKNLVNSSTHPVLAHKWFYEKKRAYRKANSPRLF